MTYSDALVDTAICNAKLLMQALPKFTACNHPLRAQSMSVVATGGTLNNLSRNKVSHT